MTQHQLVIAVVGGGTTTPEPGIYLYGDGSVVEVDAINVIGWNFDYWSLDGVDVGSANPYSVLMNTSHTLIAFFLEAPMYDLWIGASNGGEWWNTTMTYNGTTGLWGAMIPGSVANTTVGFFISAHDILGQVSTSSIYSYFVHSLLIGDLDGDGDVDIFDIVMAANNYGKNYP